MDAAANEEVEMETALKLQELTMEPRELTINELDDASGGVPLELMIGIAWVGAWFCVGAYLRTKLF